MAVLSRAVDVDDTATRLDSRSAGAAGQPVSFWNDGPATIFIGGAGVDADNGAPVPAASWSPGFELGRDEELYGVCADGESATARVVETGT